MSPSPPLRVVWGAGRLTVVGGLLLATLAAFGGPRVAVTDGSRVGHYEMVERWQVPRGPAGVPISIALFGDSVYVADGRSRSVIQFDLTNGSEIARWDRPSGWAASKQCGVVLGGVMAADDGVFALWGCPVGSTLTRLDPGGGLTHIVDVARSPWGLRRSVIARGRLYVTDGQYLSWYSLLTGTGFGAVLFEDTAGAAGAFAVLPNGFVVRITPAGALAVLRVDGSVWHERSLAPFEALAVDVGADGTIFVLGRVGTRVEVRHFDASLTELGSAPMPDLEIGPDVAGMAPLGFAVGDGRIAAVVGSRRLEVVQWAAGLPDGGAGLSILGGWPPDSRCMTRDMAWCLGARLSMSMAPMEGGSAAGWVVLDQLEGTVHLLDDSVQPAWSVRAPHGALDVAGGDGVVWCTDAQGGLWRLEDPGGVWAQVEGYKGEHGSAGGRLTVAAVDPIVTWPMRSRVVSVMAATGQVSVTAQSDGGSLWPSDVTALGTDGGLVLAGGAGGTVERRSAGGDIEARWHVGASGVARRLGAAVTAEGKQRVAVLVPDLGIQVYDAHDGVLLGEAKSPDVATADDVGLRPDGHLLAAVVDTGSIGLLAPREGAPTPTPQPTAAAPPVCVLSGDKRAWPPTVVLGEAVDVELTLRAQCPPATRVDGIDLVVVVYRGMESQFVPIIVAGLETLLQGVDGRYDRVALVGYEDGRFGHDPVPATVEAPLTGDVGRVVRALHRFRWAGVSGAFREALMGAEMAFDSAPPRASRKVVLLISEGQDGYAGAGSSRPDWRPAAQRLKDAGVEIFVVGMKRANLRTHILRQIATSEAHVLTALDSDDLARALEFVRREVYAGRPGDVSLIDDLAPEMAYVGGSAVPAAHVAAGRLSWHWPVLPTWGLTVTYAVRPERGGRLETNASAVAYYTDLDGGRKAFVFPKPVIEVVTPTPSPTPLPTATASPPGQVFLPVALAHGCVAGSRGVDVVLAIDASTSMRQASGNRTRLDAAVSAAGEFLDLLRLGGTDQAAIVTFNSTAHVRQALTGDRGALARALQGIITAELTRIHLAIEEAHGELVSPRHRAGNVMVLVLLTDGRSNPEPAEVAVAGAAGAKARGILIFTIGLGDDTDADALRAIASRPSYYYHAPAADDLARIYDEVAKQIACPEPLR